MKKLFIPFVLLFVLIIAACGNKTEDKAEDTSADKNNEPTTITYESEDGPVEVPANPQKVIVLGSFAGNVMALDVPLVGVDAWAKMNPRFDSTLKDVEEVTDEDIEKIIELEPDLIIGLSTAKNIDKLKEIAPTVTFTYGKVDYLTQHLEIGKLLNKEKEAKVWVDDFKERAATAGDEIRAKIGEDTTVSVIENFNKDLYVYGDHWGRGTEILYQEMKLKMPKKVEESVLKDGYYALSQEVLPDYAGDYVILSKFSDSDNSFQKTETFKNIPAVKNGHVYEANANEFYFNDPLTLEYQLEFFKDHFLGK
ncbi:iron-hydroxamate ABC transporter substrate-binding protein [Viridibacillus sp. FSL R5-0477]|uniref:Iron compound ABC transporter substrate-binding protein n=1 Tax=Viridibacillus arenosi FSL R5-213 TaxID=1227360 RepID=W4F8L2_9BACL|nr:MULTISPECIES: iron-hydroxamate ABC transporter substrate-binding protein [Viridibacillus]ETT88594.1 iron compound ABC transporter substrate-binding protein [Viridibacillus arenosi FSL R5-213]OMC81146.1 ABC transporter substrate-binding protein [Viridibacillus sp. FSL H8-0123]OMC85101.1 ABC transporter substrate-binding protein [Viridibacillus sp. FSL H7-0596]OMC90208.1 ABC transporter substrate-binding protein [Viridibacillus arenosi]